MFCSATPTSTYRSGNSFWNIWARVDSDKSAQRTTTFGSFLPAATAPNPNPSRVGLASSLALSKMFSTSFAALFIGIIRVRS